MPEFSKFQLKNKLEAHPAWMEIDLDALKWNFQQVQSLIEPGTKIIASIKGNGYGAGAVEVADTLSDLGVYAVATGSIKDAIAIRRAGVDVKIHIFPSCLPSGVGELIKNDLIPTVCNLDMAKAVSQAATDKTVPIFIKVDTGLARVGVHIDQAEALVRDVVSLPNITIEGIFTHIPFSDGQGLDWAVKRLEEFDRLVADLNLAGFNIPITQSIASAGVVCGLKSLCNAVCVGHLLYGGLNRVTEDLGDLSQFRPVISAVRARLIHISSGTGGNSIGAGGKISAPAGTITGTIPIGIHDGIFSAVKGKSKFGLINGQRVPVLYVSQEYTTFDLTNAASVSIGDEISLLGTSGNETISLGEFAEAQGQSPLSLSMTLNDRYPRFFINKDSEDEGAEKVPYEVVQI